MRSGSLYLPLQKKTWESNNKKIRLSVDGLCNLYAWLFWSNQRAKNKWKPQIGSLCTTMWMSDQNRKCMKLIFFKGPSSQIESIHLKAHLRRPYVYDFFHCYGLNQSVWRHLFANCMSRNNFFHWYGLNQTIWRYIYAYTMDSHSAMQWSSGNQLFFPQILFCFILHVAASWLFLLWV